MIYVSIEKIKSELKETWVENELLDNIKSSIMLLQLYIVLILNKFNKEVIEYFSGRKI